MRLYRGYMPITKNKKPAVEHFGREWVPDNKLLTLEQAQKKARFAGVLEADTVFIDFDIQEHADIFLEVVKDYGVKTKVMQTTRGMHFMFSNRNGWAGKQKTHARLSIGLEADTKNGTADAYEVLKINGIERKCIYGEDITDTDQLDTVPAWLWFATATNGAKTTPDFPAMVEGDGRNDALLIWANRLQQNGGHSKEDIKEACSILGSYVFAVPLDESEINTILRPEAMKVKPIFADDEDTEADIERKKKFCKLSKDGKPYEVIDARIAEDIITHNNIMVLEQVPYLYDGGVYVRDSDGIRIKGLIRSCMFRDLITAGRLDRVYRLILSDVQIQCSIEKVNQHPRSWVNCSNGMLDLKTMQLYPHDAKYRSINQVAMMYDAGFKAAADSITVRFLQSLIPDESDRKMFLEFAGYCLTTCNDFQKFLIIQGVGGVGKSELINMLLNVIGSSNFISMPLQALGERFSSYFLLGKLLCMNGDLSSEALTDTGMLKAITGGDSIAAEIKGGKKFSFKPYAKLLFSANRLPAQRDEQSNAFYRRLMILHIDRRAQEFRDLKERLEADKSTMFHLALSAGHEAFMRGSVFESERSKANVEAYHMDVDSVTAFLNLCTEFEAGGRVKTSDMYEAYMHFCGEYDRKALTRHGFRMNMQEKGDKPVKVNGTRYYKDFALLPTTGAAADAENDL